MIMTHFNLKSVNVDLNLEGYKIKSTLAYKIFSTLKV